MNLIELTKIVLYILPLGIILNYISIKVLILKRRLQFKEVIWVLILLPAIWTGSMFILLQNFSTKIPNPISFGIALFTFTNSFIVYARKKPLRFMEGYRVYEQGTSRLVYKWSIKLISVSVALTVLHISAILLESRDEYTGLFLLLTTYGIYFAFFSLPSANDPSLFREDPITNNRWFDTWF